MPHAPLFLRLGTMFVFRYFAMKHESFAMEGLAYFGRLMLKNHVVAIKLVVRCSGFISCSGYSRISVNLTKINLTPSFNLTFFWETWRPAEDIF